MSVDASTRVENDELIEDQILTYSSGMIVKSSPIGEPRKTADGIYSVKIKATVKKAQIAEKLRAISSANVALDGESLFARMVSAQNNLSDGEAMIRSVLARHAACVVAEAVPGENGHSPLDIDPKTGEVFANVRIRIDMAKYAQFAQEVIGKLGPMAKRKLRVKCKASETEEYRANGNFCVRYPPGDTLVVVENFRTGVATCLQFERNFMECVSRSLNTGSIAFEVVLKAKDGTEMAVKEMPADERCRHMDGYHTDFWISIFGKYFRSKEGGEMGLIAPVFGATSYSGYWERKNVNVILPSDAGKTSQTYRVSLGRFQVDELKSFGNLEIRIGHMTEEGFEAAAQ